MGAICPYHSYGSHIELICPTCNTRYTTKNIDYIGARTVVPKKGFYSCDCGTTLIHECPMEMDWRDIDQTLAMYRRQDRDLLDVKRMLERDHGSAVGKELSKRYEKTFATMSIEKASGVERMLYEHKEGFSPNPEIAREQAKRIIEDITREKKEELDLE